jgi:uncharacterized Zn-binding protein involved in type VI secretion
MADDSAHKPPNPGAASNKSKPPAPVSGDELRRILAEQAAALEAQIQRACQPEPPSPPASNKLGARKDARFMAICTAPSINWTPAGATKVPVPYQTVQDLSNSVGTARTVRFNGAPAYLLDQTTQPKGTGDERGTGKGIRSGTVGGEVKPVSGCKTVRIEGKLVVREGDKCTMNGGNNPGLFIAKTTDVESPSIVGTLKAELNAAIDKSASAIVGAIKGFLNTVPDFVEVTLQGSAIEQASELEERQHLLRVFGHWREAERTQELAGATRKASKAVEVPKFPLANDAERGGATAVIAVETIGAGVGLIRAGAKLLRKSTQLPKKIEPTVPSPSEASAGSNKKKAASIPENRSVDTLANLSSSTKGNAPSASGVKILKEATSNRTLRSASDVNREMKEANMLPAWMEGTDVITEEVPPGSRYYMVVAKEQAEQLALGKPYFGGWVTPDPVPNQLYARQKLAILEEFKPDVSYVVEVEVTAHQQTNRGITGPMREYGGGARQIQLIGQRNLRVVGKPKKLPEGKEDAY